MLKRSVNPMSRLYNVCVSGIKYVPGKQIVVSGSATFSDSATKVEHTVLSKPKDENFVLGIEAKNTGIGLMAIIPGKFFSIEVPTPHRINSVEVMHEDKLVYSKKFKQSNQSGFFKPEPKGKEKKYQESPYQQPNRKR